MNGRQGSGGKTTAENSRKNVRHKGYGKGTEWAHGVKETFVYLPV